MQPIDKFTMTMVAAEGTRVGGKCGNQVELIYWMENISKVKIKILWIILKIRGGCTPIAPSFPLPMEGTENNSDTPGFTQC